MTQPQLKRALTNKRNTTLVDMSDWHVIDWRIKFTLIDLLYACCFFPCSDNIVSLDIFFQDMDYDEITQTPQFTDWSLVGEWDGITSWTKILIRSKNYVYTYSLQEVELEHDTHLKKKDAITDRSRSMLLIEHYKQCNQPGFTETNDKLDLQSLSAVLYHNGDADVRIVGLVAKI